MKLLNLQVLFIYETRTFNLPELELGVAELERLQISHGRFRQKKDISGINFDNSKCS